MAKTKKSQTASAVEKVPQVAASQTSVVNVAFESRNVADGSDSRRKQITSAKKAGIVFPPTRFRNNMKKANLASRVGAGAGVYCAAVIEYLVAEVLELSGNAARDFNKKIIKPRHVMLATRNDEELNLILSHVTFAESGILPGINPVLLHSHTPLHLSREKFSEIMSQKEKKDAPPKMKKKVVKAEVVEKSEASSDSDDEVIMGDDITPGDADNETVDVDDETIEPSDA